MARLLEVSPCMMPLRAKAAPIKARQADINAQWIILQYMSGIK